MTFYIYEVVGDKNGATKNWKTRFSQNFSKYHIQPILIETMEGPDTEDMWQLVGDREWELADQNGYDRGEHYKTMRLKALKIDHSLIDYHSSTMLNARRKSANTQTKFTKEQVLEIQSKYVPKKYTQGMLAEEYGVHIRTIRTILKNKYTYKQT